MTTRAQSRDGGSPIGHGRAGHRDHAARDWVFSRLIPTTTRAAALARTVLVHPGPLPVLVTARRVASGVVSGQRRTPLIAVSTMARIVVLSGGVGTAVVMGARSRAVAGAWALLSGIMVETAFLPTLTFPDWSARLRILVPRTGPEGTRPR